MAVIGAVLAGTVAAGSTVAGLDAAVGASNAAEFQADQAEINAEQLRKSTALEAQLERRRGRSRIGAAEASIGASGATRAGSAVSLISDEIFEDILNQAIVTSRGGQAVTRQLNLKKAARQRGRTALTAGSINAVTSGVSLGTQVGSIL